MLLPLLWLLLLLLPFVSVRSVSPPVAFRVRLP